MRTKNLVFFICICLINLSLFNCKKSPNKKNTITATLDTSLPGFYNINFNTIFTQADAHAPNDELLKLRLNNYFIHTWKDKKLSGGILIARGNNILLEKYTGYTDINSKIPITFTTPMHIASVSKILTSLAILKLVEAQKLTLDQKVNTLLPSFPYSKTSVKDLLSHRSGLPNYAYLVEDPKVWNKNRELTNLDVLQILATFKPKLLSEPDTHFSYSNTNFALLALIVEKITKNKFPEALDKMIFKPLGMNHSYVFQKKDSVIATPSYYANGKPYKFDHLDLIYGDKNVYTTPEDLFRLSQAMYAPNFLRKDLLKLMFTPNNNEKEGIRNYGLGMRMMIFGNGKKVTYHNGWWHGSNAVFVHLLDEKITIIAIGNKFSGSVYSAFKLVSLFGNYPIPVHVEEADPKKSDSASVDLNKTSELSKKPDSRIKKRDSLIIK